MDQRGLQLDVPPWSLVSQPLGAVHLSAERVLNLPNQSILTVWLNGGEPC